MPFISSSGRHFRLDGPSRPPTPLRVKAILFAAALLFCWLTLRLQGSAVVAAEASRTSAVAASSFQPAEGSSRRGEAEAASSQTAEGSSRRGESEAASSQPAEGSARRGGAAAATAWNASDGGALASDGGALASDGGDLVVGAAGSGDRNQTGGEGRAL
ncbi:hypothetical protein AB1Y20_013082 [Prymnesium parvum]|uniref:Uncharacterized protein n=1 Tax=Prymnesium parvum TaxID=97485 RepID=A0AB34IKI0_PRYPA